MIAKLRRPVALLLVLLTLFSLVPFGFADDFPTIQSESGVDPPTGETAPIEEAAATEPPAETTEPLTDAPTEAHRGSRRRSHATTGRGFFRRNHPGGCGFGRPASG